MLDSIEEMSTFNITISVMPFLCTFYWRKNNSNNILDYTLLRCKIKKSTQTELHTLCFLQERISDSLLHNSLQMKISYLTNTSIFKLLFLVQWLSKQPLKQASLLLTIILFSFHLSCVCHVKESLISLWKIQKIWKLFLK